MVKAKKFGAFAGVFTPSILTILGVIMYMRLGWVVGQAGLINTIVIIMLAHVISISTGLSVSSIATDKNIKAGGIYYILSRSLGLPMGGAIGITLFVGTALSISLYLVGFAENFLNIEEIRTFLGLEQNVNGYRIVGTTAILILVIIAFISTSLAIKTQFYILAAIVLSLFSILAGFMINTGYHPESANIGPLTSDIDLAVVFAVFFPAVTGFTAGVAMSGDLKDPRKAIPRGTLLSIIVGLVVYIGLSIAIAYSVNRDLLVGDFNFLMKVAWIPLLVIAGIWGATLSSAMGGILGGPRILQAMSSDRIGPKVFSKVYGVNNEPRIALIVIFLIAEAGILIGELNMIARIVSMFYLASYGFINIAYYLESWASADFRPSFKISRYIGLIGFIAAFGVMFQLDPVSMIAALIIMSTIYFILKRQQLKLDYGDVWQSVWSSLMRTALDKMDKAEEVERNWQPNIVLFSGGTKKRPHLISLGKCLVGRHGVMSNFDLIENRNAKVLFPKKHQSIPGESTEKGVFTRKQTVKDIYDGIETISRTYGFSGLEPNTVMLGWARQTEDPVKFVNLLTTLYNLDLNVLMLGYDKRFGFGKKETIDIWFRDKSNHGNLALTLSKLLIMSNDWQNASVRVLVVNYRNEKSEAIYKRMENILEHMRIRAEIKVINNQIEQISFYKIVEAESAKTDLVFLEIPKIKPNEEHQFVEKTNDLLEKIGTVVLIEASSSFKKLNIGSEEIKIKPAENELSITLADAEIPHVDYHGKPELREEIEQLSDNLIQLVNDYYSKFFHPLLETRSQKLKQINQAIEKSFDVLNAKMNNLDQDEKIKLISQLKTGILIKVGKIIDELFNAIKEETEESLKAGTDFYLKNLNDLIRDIPARVPVKLTENELQINQSDRLITKLFKRKTALFKNKKSITKGIEYPVLFRRSIQSDLPLVKLKSLKQTFETFGRYNITFVFELQKILYALSDAFLIIEKNVGDKKIATIISESKENVFEQLDRLRVTNSNNTTLLLNQLQADIEIIIRNSSELVQKIPANSYIRPYPKKEIREITKILQNIPEKWSFNQKLLLKSVYTESRLLVIEYRLYKIIQEALREIKSILDYEIFQEIDKLKEKLNNTQNEKYADKPVLLNIRANNLQLKLNKQIDRVFRNIKSVIRQLPQSIEVFNEETINELTNIQYEKTETEKIPVFRIVDFVIQNDLIAPFVNETNSFVKTIKQAITKIEDSARVISLGIKNGENSLPGDDLDQFESTDVFLEEQQAKFENNRTLIHNEFVDYEKNILKFLNDSSRELHLFRLSKAAEHSTLITRKEAEKSVRIFRKYLTQINTFIQKQRANIWHSQSAAKLLAKKISDSDTKKQSTVDKLLDLNDSVSARQNLIEKLPFYYQQLFLSKYNYQSEFWYGRKDELNEAKKAINRYLNGQKGILIINGEWRSGKSFFSNHIVSNYLKSKTVFNINPQSSGSASYKDFIRIIKEETGIHDHLDKIFNNLPEDAVMIFDDIDLWWDKSVNSENTIQTLFNLVQSYNNKVFFILVFPTYIYSIINETYPFARYSLKNIELQPFSSKELQEIILFRHKTSGFSLQVDGIIPTGLSQAKQARLFNQIFKFSKGNVGAALLCWISNIRDFKHETVFIRTPRSPDLSVLETLSLELKVILMQFVLHRRLSITGISQIIREPETYVVNAVDYLIRAGLLNKQADGIYELNVYMHFHLMRYLLNEFDAKDK